MTQMGGTNDLGSIFKLDLTTGLNNVSKSDANTKIYPNPSCDAINITTTLDSFSYSILDKLGKNLLIQKSQNKTETINTDFLDDGIYFIQIMDEKGKILKIEKLIKD